MARARNFKPSFFKNEELAEQSYEARLLFIGTWTLADREGRLEDRPKKIKMEIFPADSVDVDKLLQRLHDARFIHRYHVDGKRYIQIIKFKKHQNPHHREPPSTISPPSGLGLDGDGNVDETEAGDLFHDTKTLGGTEASPADTGYLIPDSGSLIPDSPSLKVAAVAAAQVGLQVWNAYAQAYQQRYNEPPTRNGRVNSQIALFIKRVPADEAANIAAFYVSHSKAYYVEKGHPIGAMLSDAEWLRTQWKRKRRVTSTEARQADQTSARGEQVQRLISEGKAA